MTDNEIVWESVLDGRFKCRVVRTGDRTGKLTVHEGDHMIGERAVSFSYGAIFGPDVDDVAHWQMTSVDIVDSRAKPRDDENFYEGNEVGDED